MELSSSLLKSFASTVNEETEEASNTAYGTVVVSGDSVYVMLDGSTTLTPVVAGVDSRSDDRVIVTIENHTATITSNITSPASAYSASDITEDYNLDYISDYQSFANQITQTLVDAGLAYYDSSTGDAVIVNGATTAYYQTSAPTGGSYNTNDIWFDSDNGYTMYHWNGSTWVNDPYGTAALASGSITEVKIADNAISAGKIQSNAVIAGKIAASAVTADTIAASAVTAGKIATGAVTAGTIAAGAVTTDSLAAISVTTGKIASYAVTADIIAASAVTADKIAASAVTTDKLAANAVTAAKINVTDLFAQTITATGSIIGATLSTGSYFNVNSSGILSAQDARFCGSVYVGSAMFDDGSAAYAQVMYYDVHTGGVIVPVYVTFSYTIYATQIYGYNINCDGTVEFPGVLSNQAGSSAYYCMLSSSAGQLRYGASSSIRYKNVIRELTEEDILPLYSIPTYYYQYKDGYLADDDERCNTNIPGFIAERWEEVLPIAVDHLDNGLPERWNVQLVVPLTFEMVKHNHTEIEELKAQIALLEAKLEALQGAA